MWHWGVRCYSSNDLYNWEDRGLVIEPDLSDPSSPLHPAQHLDRPHIRRDTVGKRYVCWIKVMGAGQGAYFRRGDKHYLITSGTSGYFPNPSQIAVADHPHGPWRVLGNLHPSDPLGTSFRSQISSVFRHPDKQDLYIALADRWLPHRSPEDSNYADMFRRFFSGDTGEETGRLFAAAGRDIERANTSQSRYV